MAMSSDELLAKVKSTFPILELWGNDLATVFEPAPTSALAEDDSDWPPAPLSQLATVGLSSAHDHLDAIAAHIEARRAFLLAQLSAVRGALIGAAQAVWLLAPEDSETRVERARTLAEHSYNEHGKYLDVLHGLDRDHFGTRMVAEGVGERLEQIRAHRAAHDQRAQLNTTEMVRVAAEVAFSDQALTDEAIAIWRLTSGAAHGFQWSLFNQPNSRQVGAADEHGRAVFEVEGSIDRIANGYVCAFLIAKEGWALRKLRSAARAS